MKARDRIVVYTAIVNNYDVLRNPSHIDDTLDYVCFTDQPQWLRLSTHTVWTIRPIPPAGLDSTRMNRMMKLQPHRFFPDHDYSIYVDGCIDIIGDVRSLLQKYAHPRMLSFRHPLRDCIYEEGEVCIQMSKDDPEAIRNQLEHYRSQGHPENFSLIEAGVLIRKHNDDLISRLMDEWWQEVLTRSRRDQLSFPYVARRNGFWPTMMGNDHVRGASAYFALRTNIGHRPHGISLKEKMRILNQVHLLWRFRRGAANKLENANE